MICENPYGKLGKSSFGLRYSFGIFFSWLQGGSMELMVFYATPWVLGSIRYKSSISRPTLWMSSGHGA
jgi:hypothetical protein